MILNEGQSVKTNCPLPSHAFTIQNSPLAFEILSSRLYSDPVMAVVRELLSNAYDSQCLAGKENVPVKVQLPDYLNPNFTVRDYGIGLEKDEVLLLYTSFFSSTKSASNDFTGCFGLGSKTPFSYASGFTVNSCRNGCRHKFMMVKKGRLPHAVYAGKDFTDEPDGLEIIIPVNENDFNLFKEKVFSYLKYIPEIKTTLDSLAASIPAYSFYPFEGIDNFMQLNFYRRSTGSCFSRWSKFYTLKLKQGTNVYEIESLANRLAAEQGKDCGVLAGFSEMYSMVLEVPVGTFEVTPNREMIDSTPKTLAKLGDLLDKVQDRLFRTEFSGMDNDFQRCMDKLRLQRFNEQAQTVRSRSDNIIASGYNNTALVPCITWCKRYGSLSKITNYAVEKGNDNIFKGTSLFIDVPLKYKSSKLTKIIYRLINYADKFKQYNNIYINYIPIYTKKINKEISLGTEERKSYHKFKQAVKEINEQTGVSFTIHYTNLNKFIRQYPNGDKPLIFKEKSVEIDANPGFLARKAFIAGKKEYVITSMDRSKRHYFLEYFKDECPASNTLIFYNEQMHEDMGDLPDWYWIIDKLGLQNDNSFKKFIDEHTKNNPLFTQISHIVSVSNKNIKYFKDYVTVPVKDLIEYYRNLDIKIYKYSCISSLIDFAKRFKDLLELYPENLRDAINKTVFPKKMELLDRIFSREPSVLIRERNINAKDIIENYKKINDNILHNPDFSVFILNLDNIASFYEPYLTILNEAYRHISYYRNISWEKRISRKDRLKIAELILKRSSPCSTLTTEIQ